MTRKDFQQIAEALLLARPDNSFEHPVSTQGTPIGDAAWQAWRHTVAAMSRSLQLANGRFDSDRFLRACGYQS